MNHKTPGLDYRGVTFDELEFHVRRGRQLQREAVADFLRAVGAGVSSAFRSVGTWLRGSASPRPQGVDGRHRRHA